MKCAGACMAAQRCVPMPVPVHAGAGEHWEASSPTALDSGAAGAVHCFLSASAALALQGRSCWRPTQLQGNG
jgi:hypothetical protein